MLDYCAFSKDHKCIKWEDYQIMMQEIEEADELCHGNWIEIEKQYNYILELQKILDEHGIDYPVLL
jgi:hypothetical protein